VTAQGAGLVDVGGAAATELAASPVSLALGNANSAKWSTQQVFLLRNVSTRMLKVSVGVSVASEGAASMRFTVRPTTFYFRPGKTVRVHVTARVTSGIDGGAPVEGTVVATPLAGNAVRVPWVITFGPQVRAVLSSVHLSARAFTPSDTQPTLLTFVAGAVPHSQAGQEVQPVARVDLELWSPTGGRIGLLAQLLDVLPGRYSYGVTGRDPTGQVLPSGDYLLKLIAYPVGGGAPTVRTVSFRIK
jgi:hypothetical protein